MKGVQHALDESRKQLGTHEKKLQDGERQMRRLLEEMAASRVRPKPEVQEGLPTDVHAALETRFEEAIRKSQRQYSQWQGDSVKDFQSVEIYLTQVHTMVTEMHHRLEPASSFVPNRPRVTKLTMAARKGDTRVEVESSEACRIGARSCPSWREREAKMVIDKGGHEDDIRFVCYVDLLERSTRKG